MEASNLDVREHDFALILGGIDDFDDDLADALYEAGCSDATISLQRGVVTLDFARSAPSMREAIITAIRDVHESGLGVYVLRVDDCLFVTQAEIAARCNLTTAAISNYVAGKRGPGGFPKPACHITDGHPLWQWCEVAFWLRHNGMIGNETLHDSIDVMNINAQLDYHWAKQDNPEEFDAISGSLRDLYRNVARH